MRAIAILLVTAMALGACTERAKRVYFDGKYYPTKSKKVKGDRESFVVSVRRASQGIEGAREAGRHGGVQYCIKNFGYSEIEWTRGPDDETTTAPSGTLVLQGRCLVWE